MLLLWKFHQQILVLILKYIICEFYGCTTKSKENFEKQAVAVSKSANDNSIKHFKSNEEKEKVKNLEDKAREKLHKAEKKKCDHQAQLDHKGRLKTIAAWYKKNYDECQDHNHKMFKK